MSQRHCGEIDTNLYKVSCFKGCLSCVHCHKAEHTLNTPHKLAAPCVFGTQQTDALQAAVHRPTGVHGSSYNSFKLIKKSRSFVSYSKILHVEF